MTREEAYKHYEYLKKTGKFEEFRKKTKSQLSGKDLELFFFDDGDVLYNPFSGKLTKVDHDHPVAVGSLTFDQLRARGLLKGMKLKSYSEMTPEELALFTNTEEDEDDDTI